MKSLADGAGIPITWNAAGDEVVFDSRLKIKEVNSRSRGELRPVLPDDESCEPANAVQYWMYNGISLPEHAQALANLNIQYELTLLYPGRLGAQRSKTLGHIHTFPPSGKLNYAEVCEVLWGEALFVFQMLDVDQQSAPFCYAVRAGQGDKVVFPPNLHHFTVNASEGMMLFSDFISLNTRGNYDGLSAMGGGAYVYTDGWSPNPTYRHAAPLQIYEAQEHPAVGLTRDVPLYELIWRSPDSLRWLDAPDSFGEYFPQLLAQMPYRGELP